MSEMKNERNKALSLLLLSSLPLLLEMHADMSTIVDWRIILLLLLYTMFAVKATKAYQSDRDNFYVFALCCKESLVMTVCYSWMSLFSNIGKTLVPCMLFQAEGRPDESLVECRRHGLITKCLKSVTILYRANQLSNQCPSAVLGTPLGSIYLLIVVLCRFVPTAFYGLWSLYVWDTSTAFQSPSTTHPGSLPKTSRQYRSQSPKVLLLCVVVVLCCMIVNISIQDVPPLVHVSTTLPFFSILVMYYNLNKMRYRENVKHTIGSLMTVSLYMSVAYSILDFVMNCLSLVNTCIQSDAREDGILERCSDPQGPMSIQQCYETVSEMDPTYFASSTCPVFGSPSVTLRYVGDAMLVTTLTIGLMVAFSRGCKERD